MYQGKRKLFNLQRYEEDRKPCVSYRGGAIHVAFEELEDILNKSELARQYFQRSQSWISQRINGSMVADKKSEFKPDEARQLAEAFRDIARRLTALSEEIDAVADID